MYLCIFLYKILCKVGLSLTSIILDYNQRLYTYQLFSFSNLYPTKQILSISFMKKDKGFQLKKLPDKTFMQTKNVWPKLYGQQLVQQIITNYSINLTEKVKPIIKLIFHNLFKPQVIIKSKKKVIKKVRKDHQDLVFQTNSLKLD